MVAGSFVVIQRERLGVTLQAAPPLRLRPTPSCEGAPQMTIRVSWRTWLDAQAAPDLRGRYLAALLRIVATLVPRSARRPTKATERAKRIGAFCKASGPVALALLAGVLGAALVALVPRLGDLLGANAADSNSADPDEAGTPWIVDNEYDEDGVYEASLAPRVPLLIELPPGERAANILIDQRYWEARATTTTLACTSVVPCVNRIAVRAIDDSGGDHPTTMHIETSPSNLRITVALDALNTGDAAPAVLRFKLPAKWYVMVKL
jgi:hypothetical protein